MRMPRKTPGAVSLCCTDSGAFIRLGERALRRKEFGMRKGSFDDRGMVTSRIEL